MEQEKKGALSGSGSKYAWVIFLSCVLTAFVYTGATNNSRSLYLQPVSEGIGLTRFSYSMILFGCGMISVLFSFFLGKIHKVLSLRKMMIIGLTCAVCGLLLLTFTESVPGLIAGEALISIGNGFCSMSVLSLLIRSWYANRNGTMLGALSVSTGLGSIVFGPIIGRLIANRGYHISYGFQAGMLFICLLLVIFLVYETPEERGKTPFRFANVKKEAAAARGTGLMIKEAMRLPQFWIVLFIGFGLGFGMTVTQGTYGAYIGTDLGYGTIFAASIMSLLYVVNSAGKVPLGYLIDRYGVGIAVIICSAGMIGSATMLYLLTPTNRMIAYGFALFHGIGNMCFAVVFPHVGRGIFGEKDVTNLTGVFMATCTLGTQIASPIVNGIAQQIGSYRPIYFATIFLMILVTVLAIFFTKPAYETAKEE